MIRYGSQHIDEEDLEYANKALKGELLTTGPLVEEFERALTDRVGEETFVVNSGTAALHCAYIGLRLNPGDEVIMPPNTFIATQATAVHAGLTVKFADIELSTGLISIKDVESKITKKTKAIVVVDYAGQPCDMDKFKDLARTYKLFLIEDAAHSLGSTYKNRNVGSLADVTTLSFFPTKNITTGEGGAVASNNPEIFKYAKRFSRQGLVRDATEFVLQPDGPWHQEVHDFGLNYRLTDFQSALGISQLKKLDIFKEKRRLIRNNYIDRLSNDSRIRIIEQNPDTDPMWHLFPIRIPKEKKRRVFEYLSRVGIQTQVNYFPAHMHPVFRKLGWRPNDLPYSKLFYEEELSLPMHVNLSLDDIDYICTQLAKAIQSSESD